MPRIPRAGLIAGALVLATTIGSAQTAPAQRSKHKEPKVGARAEKLRPVSARPAPVTATDIAREYLRQHAGEFGLTPADIADVIVTSEVLSEHNGVTHVYLRQRFSGIEVHGAEMNVNVTKDGQIFGAGNSFVPNLVQSIRGASPDLDAVASAKAAARHLRKALKTEIEVVHARGGRSQESTLSDGGIANAPIGAKLVYEPLASGEVALAWLVQIDDAAATHLWELTVDAANGEVLEQVDLTVHDTWEEPDWDEVAASLASAESSTLENAAVAGEGSVDPMAAVPVPGVPGSGTYRVFAWPFGDPNDGPRSLVVDPADAFSSPFGWHDIDGQPGGESTFTVGNNVDAYLDPLNAISGFPPLTPSDTDRVDGGPARMFDHPLDLNLGPSTYRAAALTNLFYWTNIVHDVTYRYGFNEAAGNFQLNQYGRFTPPPGVMNTGANDPVRAEAQDGGGFSNANFLTPIDGNPPRMQMYVWLPQGGYEVQVLDGVAAGNYAATRADFGAFLADSHVTQPTGQVVATTPLNACAALPPGSLTGKIAFIEGGVCTNLSKVQRAQDAGAVGVILATTAGTLNTPIPGASATIHIPVLALTNAPSTALRSTLPFTAKMAFLGVPAPLRDGSLDASVIAHEYAHGISLRLTGGRLNTSCLSLNEQMGEGWSDFLGLVLTHDGNHALQRTRGMSPYIRFTGLNGAGIRPTPYSTDVAINPTTYGTTNNGTLTVPHGIGYAWASMLWEVYWNLIDKHGFNPNVYDAWNTGGNNLAIQLVMDGMKMQPCQPGFVDARNAMLDAELALTAGANKCEIWRGFAKRGLGVSAKQNSPTNNADNIEAFDLPLACLQPQVSVAPESLSSTQVLGRVVTHPLTITNSAPAGNLDLGWTITETVTDCSTPSDVPWLSVTPASGVTAAQSSANAMVTFNSTDLGVGTYPAKLCVGGPGAETVEVPVSMTVIYDFEGPFARFGFEGNRRKGRGPHGGEAVQVKFGLGGFHGLDIFEAGFPASRRVSCTTGAPLGSLETARGEDLRYLGETELYLWIWKTSKSWRDTCRELIIGLDDGTHHSATFFLQ